MDLKIAAEQGRTLAHAEQPHGAGIVHFCLGDAPPIIFYFQDYSVVSPFQIHCHLGGPCMTNDIREGLLEDTEKSCVQILRKGGVAQAGMDITFDPGAILEFVGLPLQRRGKAKIIEYSRTEFAGDTPDGLDGRINVL
jgi:hypothetical protein